MIPADQSFIDLEQRRGRAEALWIFTIDGYEVPQKDIIDPGSLAVSRAYDLDDIPTGDNTVILDNFDYKYSPGKPNFILGSGHNWYMANIKIELGYRIFNSKAIHKIKLYEGYITEWRVSKTKGNESSSIYPTQVEITSQSFTYRLGQILLGRSGTDGTRNPLIYGSVIKDAEELGDKIFWTPDHSCNADSGDLSCLDDDGVTSTGVFEASTTEYYSGTHSYKAHLPGTGSTEEAWGKIALTGTKNLVLFTAMVKFTVIPSAFSYASPDLFKATLGATPIYIMRAKADGTFYPYDYVGGYKDTDTEFASVLNRWVRISIGFCLAIPGGCRTWIDGNVIAESSGNFVYGIDNIYFGFTKSTAYANDWTVYWDDVQIFEDNYYPCGNYLPGYPFTSIDGAYRDGTILPKTTPKTWIYRQQRAGYGFSNFTRAVLGKFYSNYIYTSDASIGLVDFVDVSDPPDGTVLIGATKNTTVHPVDIISGILTESGYTDKIDSAWFDRAKAVYPDDSIGAYYEDATAIQAIGDISYKTMYDLWDEQGVFRIKAYTGEMPREEIIAIAENDIISIEEEYDATNLRSRITGKYGWYSRDKVQFYQVSDSDAEDKIGIVEEEVDFGWSEETSSENQTMVESVVDRMRYRLRKQRHIVNITLGLKYGRIELGDIIKVSQSQFWDNPIMLDVYEKTYNMTSKVVEIVGIRYLGEEL